MTEPVDPNVAPWYPPPPAPASPYQPPPPFAPPPGQAPGQPGQPPGQPLGQPLGQPPGQPPGQLGPGWAAPWPPGGMPPPLPPPQTPPPSQRRRTVLIIALVVLLVAAGVGGYAALGAGGSSTHRIAIPASFDGYTRLDNAQAHQLEGSMRGMASGMGGAQGKLMAAAAIGAYARDSGDLPTLIAFALPTKNISASGASARQLQEGLTGLLGSGVETFPPGPHGGSLDCGGTQIGAAGVTLCMWSDSATIGILESVRQPMSPAQLAAISLDFRDAVD